MSEPKRINVEDNDSKLDQTDEIGTELETGSEVNEAIKKQGEDASAAIPRDADAAKHEQERNEAEDDNKELTGAP